MKNPLNRLLRRNVSAGQLVGYALANLVGLAIVLTAMQFYRDVSSITSGEDSFISRDYLIISKKVEGLGSLGGSTAATDFTADEIADIKAQPWTRRVAGFTAAGFNVAASLDFAGRGLSTSLFLESIPTDYFDVVPPGWGYTPGSGEPVPVVISKDYLTLYNFGYASTHGMPRISEAMVSMVPLRLSLSGNGRQEWVNARIVGFSQRLNTIAVPEEFLSWANARFSEEPPAAPSRLIIELNRAGDPAATAYLDDHSYEAAGDKADNGRAAFFLGVVTTVVVAVGTVISALAFFILLLSIYLLLQKNRRKLHRLMELGYTPAQVARSYYIMVAAVNLAVVVAALAIAVAAHLAWRPDLESLGAESASVWPTVAVGFAAMIAITLLNMLAIRRRVVASFR